MPIHRAMGERRVQRGKGRTGHSPGVAARFFVVLAVLVPSLLAVAGVGAWGLQRTAQAASFQYTNNVRTIVAIETLGDDLSSSRDAALMMLVTEDADAQQQLQSRLVADLAPRVEVGFASVSNLLDPKDPSSGGQLAQMLDDWRRFSSLMATGQLLQRDAHQRSAIAAQVASNLDPVVALGRDIAKHEADEARDAHDIALAQRTRSLQLMGLVLFVALASGVGAIVWLIRTVLPRIRAYSRFASRVAEGDDEPMRERMGNDEIGQLGNVMQDMAARGRFRRLYEQTQLEFSETLQLTADESEAHAVLKRHLERSLTETDVTVLNRNNSADRLEAVTPISPDSPLLSRLEGAKPRSCLAVRHARTHRQGEGLDPLVACSVCDGCATRSSCTPLLVSGEVIGSVLALHEAPLEDNELGRIRESVAQAAPILANLRNLAIAELRASTDALTGLPNKRAASDSMKRMVAQALRTGTTLAVLMLDLDHFKQINDRFGHGRGNEVLAAVGAALRAVLRDADFAGRYGGEEFVAMLPGVSIQGAIIAAEKIRSTFSDIFIADLDHAVTASIGIAMIPDHGGDPTSIERAADNALYAAKRNGRDRVEIAGSWDAAQLLSLSSEEDTASPA
jgi:diguanylate cyclase (GGDEF)-like protein